MLEYCAQSELHPAAAGLAMLKGRAKIGKAMVPISPVPIANKDPTATPEALMERQLALIQLGIVSPKIERNTS